MMEYARSVSESKMNRIDSVMTYYGKPLYRVESDDEREWRTVREFWTMVQRRTNGAR